MKYYLIYTDGFNFDKIIGFSKFIDLSINENKLNDIVQFTNTFKNYQELLEFLYYNGLIPDMNGKINIGYKSKKDSSLKILPFGLSFKGDAKFFDFNYLSNYYINHMTDEKFMNNFLNRYYNYLKNTPNVGTFITNIKNNYEIYLEKHIQPLGCHIEMRYFLNNYTYKKYKNSYKRDFTKLRDLAMFAINYSRQKEIIRQDDLNDREIILQIKHLKELLQQENLDEEVIETYENKINYLENLMNGKGRNRQ